MSCNNMCNVKKPEHYMQNCKCLDELPLAIAYVPWQKWKNVMCAKEGIQYGSIFADLVMPFYGCKKQRRGV